MGAISIGLKTKPKGKISIHSWGKQGQFAAIDNEKSEISTAEEFCEGYIDSEKAEVELKELKSLGLKFVIYTRKFAFGNTRAEARKNLLD